MENLLNKFKNGFKIKNALSNEYLYLEEIQSSEAKNIYQIGYHPNPPNAIWKIREAGNDYVYISSISQKGDILYLTCVENNNIVPIIFTGEDNQKFYIQYKEKGLYYIKSKSSKNKFCIELKSKKIGINNKVTQGLYSKSLEQNWFLEPIINTYKTNKLKTQNNNSNMNEKREKVVKTVIYKDDELVHTVVFVK